MADDHNARVLRMARKHLLPHLEFEPLTARALTEVSGLARSSVNAGLKALADAAEIYTWEHHGRAPVWTVPGWHLVESANLTPEQLRTALGTS